jgi:hypothetical protein
MMTLSRRSWLAHTACASLAAVRADAASGTGFQISYAAGGRDAAGRFMGGTEMRVLAAHRGKLFAGNGYWEDQPDWEVPPGAQILVLDRPDGAWAVDHDFDAQLARGRRRHLAVSALRDVVFGTSATGAALRQPVSILLASTWDLTGTRTVFARDATTGQWSDSAIAYSPPAKDFLPQIRCFGQHRDAVTGADLVFAGDSSGIFRGAVDLASGSLRWELTPELAFAELNIPAAPGIGDRLRAGAFAEANGVLYVSVGQQIYQRGDGRTPSWRLLYTNPQQHVTETGLRGMTAVANPTGREMLLAVAEGYQSRIIRIDPADGSETTELDLDAFLNHAWGTRVSFVIAAYNDMTPIGGALLIGLEAFIPPRSPKPPGHTVLDVVHGLEAGAWYLIREKAGQYRLRQVDVEFPRIRRSLVAVRAILASPFPGDRAVYFAGYDANHTPAHDSAWIARAATSVALSE